MAQSSLVSKKEVWRHSPVFEGVAKPDRLGTTGCVMTIVRSEDAAGWGGAIQRFKKRFFTFKLTVIGRWTPN